MKKTKLYVGVIIKRSIQTPRVSQSKWKSEGIIFVLLKYSRSHRSYISILKKTKQKQQ